jgi:hypothetical protein
MTDTSIEFYSDLFIQTAKVPANSQGFPHADTFLINGSPCPGKATLIAGGSPRPWDIRKGYALSGATVVPAGDDLSKPHFRIELWDPADYTAWLAFANLNFAKSVRFKPGTTIPLALGIYHPVLSASPYFVNSVVVEDVTALVQDEYGMWTCEVHFIEYRKPKPALARPDAAFHPTQKVATTAVGALQAALVAKTARLSNLAAGGQ